MFLRRVGTGGVLVATSTLWAALGRGAQGTARRVRAAAAGRRIARIVARYGPELGRRS